MWQQIEASISLGERSEVMILREKLLDVGGQKAILFSTAGFQSGALDYARAHGIATVKFIRGKTLYETRAGRPTGQVPDWIAERLPKYAGWVLRTKKSGASVAGSLLEAGSPDPLNEWLAESEAYSG